MKTTNDVRAAFLSFFERNGHSVLPSSPLVPLNDPTLMFTAAGMVPFKNYFTGIEKPPIPRAATSQKCVRAGGKHNDLDNVGYTARHHTFFEMLGNFSFGDYFKEEAINLAWELLTKDYGLSPEKLCVTVYHDDDVAWNHWKKLTGFADHKIIRIATNDNFWSMGDTGPCGPCSEIFYDHGEGIAGGPPGSADADGDRFIEIWNLVFMQFEQVDVKTRISLPKPSIDTGMGLERISAVIQGVHDNYDIDLFKALIAASKSESGNADPASHNAHRVIADHLRSCSFLIADGVMPSNEGRGYVLRRIMRRAMRYAHQLGCKEPLMHRLVPALVEQMGAQYPELAQAKATIIDNLRQEEERFKVTLERGLKLLEEESAQLGKGAKLSGEAAFKLYDTYGFPLDLTQDILRGRGIEVDTDGFETCMEGQREMARASHKGSGDVATGKVWFELKEKLGATAFLGYGQDEAEGKVLAIVKNGAPVSSADAGDDVFIVLDQTPFYGESGGQVGDGGVFSKDGKLLAEIGDTQKPLDDFIVHKALLKAALNVGDSVRAEILRDERDATRANHSATHLLHKALRDLLGTHVTQKGSLVDPSRLRFDFSHGKAVSKEEIAQIEKTVSAVISRGGDVVCRVMTPDDAIKAGAMALFGEKYGDNVRVLSMGHPLPDARSEDRASHERGLMEFSAENSGGYYSVELCGGTHVRNVAEISAFKIASEGSVAAGIRRIEAVTGEGVRQHALGEIAKLEEQLGKATQENARLLQELGRNPPAPEALQAAQPIAKAPLGEINGLLEMAVAKAQATIQSLLDENKKLGKELADAKKQAALSGGAPLEKETVGKYSLVSRLFDDLPAKELRNVAGDILQQSGADIGVVGSAEGGKAAIVVAIRKEAAGALNAVELLRQGVAAVGGQGGGGKPDMAQGGGPEGDKLASALEAIKKAVA